MDVVSHLRQHFVLAWTGLAVAVGLGSALVTGAGVAQAQRDHHDPSGGRSSDTSSSSNSPSGSAPTTRKAPSGNQHGAASNTAPRSDAGSKKSAFNARTTTGTTPPGNGLQRRTLKPSKPLSLPSGLSAATVPKSHTLNTSSLPSLGSVTVAPNPKAAATPANVVYAIKAALERPAVSQAAVTSTALSRTSTQPPRLLTRLLGLAGPGPSAVPKTPTPLDNPLGWAMMGVVRRFGQLVSNAEETRLAQPGVTTSLTTANPAADPPAPQAAATIDRTFVIFNTTKKEIYISGYSETNGITGLPPALTAIAPGSNLAIEVPYRLFEKNQVKVNLSTLGGPEQIYGHP
jgi:hypothetical protein